MELGLPPLLEHLAIHLQLLCLLVSRLVPHAHLGKWTVCPAVPVRTLPDGEVRDLWRLSEKPYCPAGDTEVQRNKKLDLLEAKLSVRRNIALTTAVSLVPRPVPRCSGNTCQVKGSPTERGRSRAMLTVNCEICQGKDNPCLVGYGQGQAPAVLVWAQGRRLRPQAVTGG